MQELLGTENVSLSKAVLIFRGVYRESSTTQQTHRSLTVLDLLPVSWWFLESPNDE